MKRILDEDDLLAIQDTIQREIDENSFSDNYATSDRQGGAAISTKVNNATSGNFKVLLTDDSVDTHGGKQLYQDTDLTYDAGTNTINTNVTHANTANYFSEAKKIELYGDVTGSALSNGESGWNINTFLKNIIEKTTAGPNDALYGNTIDIPYIEVDEKGRVTSLINKQFIVPEPTIDTSGFLKKDSFGDEENNPVSKKEENNKIIYYHDGKTITTSTPEPATELEYDKEFSFTALSAADSYGHVNQKTTYKFKMPAAPSGNTTGIITKNDFTAGALLTVTKGENDNTVNYSHDTVSMTTINPTSATQLTYGGTFEVPALSAADSYGHVNQKTTYKFKMPKITTHVIEINNGSFSHVSGAGIHQWTMASLNKEIGSFTGLYITLYPNAMGANVGQGYDPDEPKETNNKTMVDVRLLLPGSVTFFAESPNTNHLVSFLVPRLYVLTPTSSSYHGFSYTPTTDLTCKIHFSTDHSKITSISLTCDQIYVNPIFIKKIIITAY